MNDIPWLNYLVGSMGVPSVRTRVDIGVLIGVPGICDSIFRHFGFQKLGYVCISSFAWDNAGIGLLLKIRGKLGCLLQNFYFLRELDGEPFVDQFLGGNELALVSTHQGNQFLVLAMGESISHFVACGGVDCYRRESFFFDKGDRLGHC